MNRQIIKESWQFYKAHFKEIALLMIPVIILTSLLSEFALTVLLSTDVSDSGLEEFFNVIITFLVKANFFAFDVGLFLYFMKHKIYALAFTKMQLLWHFLFKLPALIILTTLAASIIFIGFLFFFVPGIWLAMKFSYAWMYLIFDDLNPVKALLLSFKETKGELSMIFFSVIIVIFITVFLLIFFTVFASIVLPEFLLGFTVSVLSLFILLFLQVLLYRIYSEFGHNAP